MSIRPVEHVNKSNNLRAELESLQAAHRMATADHVVTFESLSEVEKSAASIGVSPDDLKPIDFMNRAHYATLLKTNALDARLTQQIEAYKVVSAGH